MPDTPSPLVAASTDVVIEMTTVVNGERSILRCLAPSYCWNGEMTLDQRASYILGLREYLGRKIAERLEVDVKVTPARYPWPAQPPFDVHLADCDLPVKLGAVYNVRFEPAAGAKHPPEQSGGRR